MNRVRNLIGLTIVLWTTPLAAQGPPEINALLNGASFDQGGAAPPVAPGSIVSIFGSRIASEMAGTATTPVSMDASMAIPLQTSLGGGETGLSQVTITFDGIAAPLFALVRTPDFDQVNAQIPWDADVTDGQVEMTVSRDGADMATMVFPAADASPGIFTTQFGVGPAIVTNVAFAGGPADVISGTFAHAPGTVCTGPGNPSGCPEADQPAPVGGVVTIWCNGLGPVDVDVESGNIPSGVGPGGFVAAVKQVRVFIGGVQAQVLGAALTAQFVALNQVNVIVPNVPPGDALPVQIEMDLVPGGTVRTREDVTMAVRAAPAAAVVVP